jgi:hypothetical protein
MTGDREPQDVETRLRASLEAYAGLAGDEPARRPPAPVGVPARPTALRRWRAPILAAAAALAVTGGVLLVSLPAEDAATVAGAPAVTTSARTAEDPRARDSAGDSAAGAESAEENSAAAAGAGPLDVPPRAEVGVPYPFDLYTHCGIHGADVAGDWFAAEPPLVEGPGSPPPGWDDPFQRGTLTLESEDEAVFRDDAGHELRLVAAPDSTRPPACN